MTLKGFNCKKSTFMKSGSHSQQLKWSMGALKKGGRLISRHREFFKRILNAYPVKAAASCASKQ